jgi:hypothetical protein
MELTTKIQVIVEDPETGFRDALYFTPEEHAALSAKQIEARAQERIDNYLAAIAAKPPEAPVPATEEQEKQSIASMRQVAASLLEQLDSLAAAKEASVATVGVSLKG